tara:strand:+ start:686 stop:1111 length:426 start_codon:yes stop_codon:yes gene_type:complete
MTFEVGEVLYLLSIKNHKIVPARVEAITTVKRRDGQDVTHELSVPGYEETVMLETLSVKAFKDTKKLKSYVMKVIREKVDTDIAEVVQAVKTAWPAAEVKGSRKKNNVKELVEEDPPDPTTVQIELEDGMRARVHLPRDLV